MIFILFILISLYLKSGLFISNSLITGAYGIQIFGISLLCVHYLLHQKVPMLSLILTLSAFTVYLLSDCNIEVYYSHVLLITSVFMLYQPRVNKLTLYSMLAIICFEVIYGIVDLSREFQDNSILPPMNGTFDNPVGFSLLLLLSIPILLHFISQSKTMILSTLIVILLAILFSQSRIGLLCFALLTAYYSYNTVPRLQLKIIKYKWIISLMILLFVVLLFFLKVDSSNGRLLIWTATCNMIFDNLIYGLGIGGFKSEYMNYQAELLSSNTNQYWGMLADNIKHPFSEYLNIIAELGITGIVIIGVVIYFMLKNKNLYSEMIAIILVVGLTSYPLSYPYVWIFTSLGLAYIIKESDLLTLNIFFRSILVSIFVVWLALSFVNIHKEYLWHKAQNEESSSKQLKAYDKLYMHIKHNPYFLYNYAVLLGDNNMHERSIDVLLEASSYLSDYDLELSIAETFLRTKDYNNAEIHFMKASQMCPNRFIPLFSLFEMYCDKDDLLKAKEMAEQIQDKRVKIESPLIEHMKYKTYIFLNDNNH